MQRKEMARMLRKETAELSILARKIVMHFKKEDIHSFRVQTKRMRAFLRLVSPAAAPRRLPDSLRRFYHAAGEVRTLQLQRESLANCSTDREQPAVNELIARLDEELIIAKNKTANLLRPGRRPFGLLPGKLTADLPFRLDQGHRQRFLAVVLDVLHPANVPESPNDDQLHSLRKAIKDLLYCRAWLGSGGRKVAETTLGNYKQVKMAGRLLGDYLDIRSKLLVLASSTDNAFIHVLRDAWAEEKASVRREVDNTIGKKLHFNTRTLLSDSKPPEPLFEGGNTPALSNELHLD